MIVHPICVPAGTVTRAVAVPNRQAVRTTLMWIGGAQGSEIVSAAADRARPSRSIPVTTDRREPTLYRRPRAAQSAGARNRTA